MTSPPSPPNLPHPHPSPFSSVTSNSSTTHSVIFVGRYIDGIAGLFTSQLGHGRQELADAYDRQAMTLGYFPIWSYAHPRAIELAERLVCPPLFNNPCCVLNLVAGLACSRRFEPRVLHFEWR